MRLTALLIAVSPIVVIARSGGRPLPKVSNIFIDFDGTIAITEAFETLADAAYASVHTNSSYPPWSYFSDTYNAEYDAFATTFGPRTNLSRELAFQSSPTERAIEAASFKRVSASGVFSQTKLANLRAAARAVQLRPGLWDLLAYASLQGVQPAVVSLNWSPSWIRLVLRENAHSYRARELVEHIPIYCSEILPHDLVRPHNPLDHPASLFTGGDKVALIKKLATKAQGAVVFIGDSKADLPPLVLKPTAIGIIAAGSASMDKALVQFGVKVRAVNSSDTLGKTEGTGALWRLESFAELVHKFRGPHSSERD